MNTPLWLSVIEFNLIEMQHGNFIILKLAINIEVDQKAC